MNDMSVVIVPRSDQINADDLLAGPRTIAVAGVSIKPGTEQPVSIAIANDEKVFRPCKSMCRVLVTCWGADANSYVGRSMTLYCDPKVTWGGMTVGGIRISHMSDLNGDVTMPLTATRGNKKPFTVKPLIAAASDPAKAWADKVLALLGGMTNKVDLMTLIDKPATKKNRDGLKESRPELSAQVEAAFSTAYQRLVPPPSDEIVDGEPPPSDDVLDFPGDRIAREQAAEGVAS